jgi:hypothetical protein
MKKISETLRRKLIGAAPDERVRVWCLVRASDWAAAQARGHLTLGADFSAIDLGYPEEMAHLTEHDRPAADWIKGKMAERVAGFSGDYPLEAFPTRPNGRQWSFLVDPFVLVTADVPRGRMLVVDYDLFVYILNYWYIARTEAEDDAFEEKFGERFNGPAGMTPEMIETWEQVFDLRKRTDPAEIAYIGACTTAMCFVDRIQLSEVVHVAPFQGRRGRKGGQRG